MADKKFIHVALVIEGQIVKDLRMELGLAVMCEQAGGVRDSFIKKLVAEVEKGSNLIRYEYKDPTRGQ